MLCFVYGRALLMYWCIPGARRSSQAGRISGCLDIIWRTRYRAMLGCCDQPYKQACVWLSTEGEIGMPRDFLLQTITCKHISVHDAADETFVQMSGCAGLASGPKHQALLCPLGILPQRGTGCTSTRGTVAAPVVCHQAPMLVNALPVLDQLHYDT